MGRARGSRNADHDQKRLALCRAMLPALLTQGRPATLKELAQAADVSVPTLRHYFGEREEVLRAVYAQALIDAAPHLRPSEPMPPLIPGLQAHLRSLVWAWRSSPLRSLFLGSITAGLGHPTLGPAAVDDVIEPAVQALEAKLQRYIACGALQQTLVARHGALGLLGPVIFALLHQDELSGAGCRPLEMDTFIDQLVDGFSRAYGVHEPPR